MDLGFRAGEPGFSVQGLGKMTWAEETVKGFALMGWKALRSTWKENLGCKKRFRDEGFVIP